MKTAVRARCGPVHSAPRRKAAGVLRRRKAIAEATPEFCCGFSSMRGLLLPDAAHRAEIRKQIDAFHPDFRARRGAIAGNFAAIRTIRDGVGGSQLDDNIIERLLNLAELRNRVIDAA